MFKSWFHVVIEKQMSVGDALAFMGLNNNVSKTDVDKRYKELSKKYHPDLGGNPEDMKTLNMARDILSKAKFSTNINMYDIREETKIRRNAIEKFAREYLDSINIKKYIDYLNKIFSENFTYNKEIKTEFLYLSMYLEFFNADRNKVFKLYIHLDYGDIEKALFGEKRVLSAKDISFKIHMYSDIYLDGKKQILTKERYVLSNKSDWNENPETLLPKERLEKLATGKVRKGKVSKKDFESMITMKYKGVMDGRAGRIISNNDKYVLYVDRFAMSGYNGGKMERYAGYSLEGIYMKDGYRMPRLYSPMDVNKKYGIESNRISMFQENEESLAIWDNLINRFKRIEDDKDLDNWLRLYASEVKKLKLYDL